MSDAAATTVWAPNTAPLPPKPWSGRGNKPKRVRREPGCQPVAVKTLALSLPPEAYRIVTWREGTNSELSSPRWMRNWQTRQST